MLYAKALPKLFNYKVSETEVREMIKDTFPKTLDEFKRLVNSLNVEEPDNWVCGEDYSYYNVVEFLFLWSIWQFIENPAQSSFTYDRAKLSRERVSANPNRSLDPSVPLFEKFLDKGITPEEISLFVMHEQWNFAHMLCYHVDDVSSCTPAMFKEYSVGLYIEDKQGQPIATERLSCLHEILYAARPKAYCRASDD